ncbi:MAG: ATP-binding protein [Candidatus Nanopelagicales bacterium]
MTSPFERDPGTWFVCHDRPADAWTAALVREDFARWLRWRVSADEAKLCDVVLAVNEALANAAEYAYLGTAGGTCDLEAVYDVAAGALTVSVRDQGRWCEPDPNHHQRHRGRGIPLMRKLADALVIDTSALGTSVCMRFSHVNAPMAGIC